VNGKSLSTEAFFISIANSNQFGNHFTIAPAASMNDGLLDIVVVNKMNKFSLVVKTLRQIRAGKISAADAPGKDKGVHYFNAAKLQIKNPELAPLHIDGDPEETAESINIEIIPGAFRLIRP
jgi:diacylglycerol kinase family enzyme